MKRIVFFSWLFFLLGVLSNAIFYEGIEAKSAKPNIVVEEQSIPVLDSKFDTLTRSSYLPLTQKIALQSLDNQSFFYTALFRFSDQLYHYDKQLKVLLNSSLMMVLNIKSSTDFNKFSRHILSADDPLSTRIS